MHMCALCWCIESCSFCLVVTGMFLVPLVCATVALHVVVCFACSFIVAFDCAFVFFHSRIIVFPISLGHWALDTGGLAAPSCARELIQQTEEFMDSKMDALKDGTDQPKWLDMGEFLEDTYIVEEFVLKLKSRTQPFGTQFK